VIITCGAALSNETLQAAELYPGSLFIGMDQVHEERRQNLIPVTFAEDQMGYLAGALAADLTETHVVAGVCETSEIDSMWRYCEGFRAGALFRDKQLSVLIEYRDGESQETLFIDDAWGYETAQGLIRRGADVIFAAGGGTGQGALRAASEAGVPSIGAERNQAAELGDVGSSVVTSIYGRAGSEIQNMLRRLRDGSIDEQSSGQFGFSPLDSTYPESLNSELKALLESLLKGEIRTNVTNKRL
jgi:basic membrane protein A